jgi:predicted PurR-regulated permease PerM
MPLIIEEAQAKLEDVSAAMTHMRAATEVVEDKITNNTEDDASNAEPQEVVVRENSTLGAVAKSARSAIVQIMLTFVMAYFFLATRTSFRIKAMAAQPTLRGKLQVARLFHDINGKVGEYILTMTMINAGLAAATTAAMMAIGMPSPLVWGMLAGVLNFVPMEGR